MEMDFTKKFQKVWIDWELSHFALNFVNRSVDHIIFNIKTTIDVFSIIKHIRCVIH